MSNSNMPKTQRLAYEGLGMLYVAEGTLSTLRNQTPVRYVLLPDEIAQLEATRKMLSDAQDRYFKNLNDVHVDEVLINSFT